MGGFFSSIFGGQDKNLNSAIGQTQQIGGFATGMGEKNLTASSNFWNSILSGDSSKMTQALAPEINSAKSQAQQDQKTGAEFGTRSGGTAAANNASNDKVHGYIANLIGSLTGSAASNLGASGSSLLGQGASAIGQSAQLSQERLNNWQQSILGQGISSGIGSAEGFGLGKIFPGS